MVGSDVTDSGQGTVVEKKFKNNLTRYLEPTMIDVFDIEESLLGIPGKRREKLFLRNFTRERLMDIMNKVMLVPHLNQLGFDKILVDIDVDESAVNYLKLYNDEISPENMLLDLRLSESKFIPEMRFYRDGTPQMTYDMIVIEWLSAQDPRHHFDSGKPQLPGQQRPGLGILKYCFEMMYVVAKAIIKDGFMDVPDHMHGAIMYSRKFKFFDPRHEGILQALVRDLKGHSLSDISWGMITQTIIDEYKNEPQVYDPSEQIFYVSSRLRSYYHSSIYKSTFKKYYKRKRYRFDYELMKERREKLLKSKNILDL